MQMILFACATVLAATNAPTLLGEPYPSRPVRIITSEPGGGSDIVARVIAQELARKSGQTFVVENRGGASGAIAGETVAKAPPDGYTLLYYGSSIWLLPFLRQNVPFDPLTDFSPITLTVTTPNILVVHPSLPAKSVQELIALAKAKPRLLNYASGNSGSSSHLAAELFKSLARVDIVRVPYKGAAQGVTELMAGQVQLMFPTAASGMPYVQTGKLRALAVTSVQPSKVAQGLPTVASAGLPGYESVQTSAMFAPVRTPEALVAQLNEEIVRILKDPKIRERIAALRLEVVGSSRDELSATIKSEMNRMGKVIKHAGITE